MKKIIIIFIFLFFFPCMIYAQYYHWVENEVHDFSNYQTPPTQKDKNTSGTRTKAPSDVAPKGSIILKESVIGPAKNLSPQEAEKVPVKRKVSVKEKDIALTDLRVMGPKKELPLTDKQAAFWHKKAAEQGDATAQFNLGIMYSSGKGVTQNYQLAYVWESLAATQGHELAIKDINILIKKLSLQELAEAETLEAKIQHR